MTVQAAPYMILLQSAGGAESKGGEKWQVWGGAAGEQCDPAECEGAAGWDQQHPQRGTVERRGQVIIHFLLQPVLSWKLKMKSLYVPLKDEAGVILCFLLLSTNPKKELN